MIVLDAAAVPDFFSGARTRLRGLVGAYAKLADAPALTLLLARGSTLLEGIALGAVQVEEVASPGGPLRRALRRSASPGTSPALVRSARLWHSETLPPLASPRIPALVTLHDLRWNEPRVVTGAPRLHWALRHAAARWWLPRLARRLAGVVTVSQASARRIEQALELSRERVHVVPNAAPATLAPRLAAEPESALLRRLGVDGRPFFLAVGHLERRKGLELALAALATLAREAVPSLVLVGDGPARAALAEQARALRIADRVVFAGRLDDAAVQSLYAHATALLFPSRCEGFGFPVHEALERGCPVVAAELDLFADLQDERLVLLPRAVAAWADRLARLLAGPPVHAASRETSVRRLNGPAPTWTDSAVRLAALYRSLAVGS